MLRKAAIIYIACFALAHVLSGCCNCPPAPDHSYRWTSVTLEQMSYSIADGKLTVAPNTGNDFTSLNYAVYVKAVYELLALQQRCSRLTNTAYACKCIEYYHAQHDISRLRVISLDSFDASHPPHSDITEYFKSATYDGNGQATGLKPSFDQAVLLPPSDQQIRSDFRLYLGVRPTSARQQQFMVELILNDSSKISAVTPVLSF